MMIGMPLLLFWPVHILLSALRAEARMTLCLAPRRRAEFRPLRFALRELRGGLRGFRIFIACIALGVMAIAGVGSFARSLTDGLAREGRVILGGDLAFSLIQREADAAERALPRHASGQVSVGATMRAMARTGDGAQRAGRAQGGRWRLSAVRHGRRSIPTCRSPTRWRQRDGAFGAAVDPTLLARLDLKPRRAPHRRQRHDRDRAPSSRASPTSSPAASASARACIVSEAALRATGLLAARQPGALALPPAAAGRQRPRRAAP